MNSTLESALKWSRKEHKLYYGGKFHPSHSKKQFEIINPTNEQGIAQIAVANSEDVEACVQTALQAKKSWKNSPRRTRQQLLHALAKLIRENQEELAYLETLSNGKLLRESLLDDLPESADVFDYYAGWIDKIYGDKVPTDPGSFNFTQREAVGLCALIVPWNFPLLMACWKIAPALALGNPVIIKASEYTPLTLLRLTELIHENLDFPPGVFNHLTGDGSTGALLADHPQIDKVAFTGSTTVGKKIVKSSANSNLKSVSLELGGKSPNILFEDTADVSAAVQRQFDALYSHKGEKCSEPTLFVVHESLYDQSLQQLKSLCEKSVLGDPFSEKSQQGAQAYKAHFEKILSYIESGKKEGARLIAGGTVDTSNSEGKGYFIRPTVFADVQMNMKIAQEEIFGPVLSVLPFKTEDEALRIANGTPYGLAAGFYTQDISRAHRVSSELEAGMIFINHYGMYDFASPFGGFKESGWGKEMSKHSLDAYTKTKSVWIKL